MTPEQAAVIDAARNMRRRMRQFMEIKDGNGTHHRERMTPDLGKFLADVDLAVDALVAAEQSAPEPDVDPDADVHLILSHLVADVGLLRERLRLIEEDQEARITALEAAVADVGRLRDGLSSVRERLDAWVHDVADHRRRIEALEAAAADVEPEPEPEPDRYVVETRRGWSGFFIVDSGSDAEVIARCPTTIDAERIAAALNAQEES